MIAAAVFVTALAAQALPPPSQTATPPPTGLIVGRVVDAASGRPVAGAVVSLVGGNVAFTGPGVNGPRAITNGTGYFVFRKLAKGTYSLTAARPGYVDGAYGRRKPGGMPMPLALDEAQRVNDVVIPIWRHATISGTVTDEAGEPLIGVQLRVFQRRIVGGRYQLSPGPQATTDDRGYYRVAALQPGDYFVAFVWHEASMPAASAELLRNGASADPKMQDLQRERFAIGGMIGAPGSQYAMQVGSSVRDLQGNAPVPPAAPDDAAVYIYPTQFYPGVPSQARATKVTLTSGQERESVDFSLKPIKTVKVSGTLMGPDGPLANTAVRLVPAADDSGIELETSAAITGEGGDFTLIGVPPGQYSLKVMRAPRVATPAAVLAMTQIQVGGGTLMTSAGPVGNPPAPPPVSDDPTLVADTPVTVGSRDVGDLLVTVQRGARLTGRVEFDGTRDRPDAAALTRINVTLDSVDAGLPVTIFMPTPVGRADETGAFKTPGVAPGRYIVRAGGGVPGWTLKSVMVEGRDVSELPLDLRGADVNNAVITFTDHPTRLTGTAHAGDGNVDRDAVVVVFPADQSAWSDYGQNARRVRSTHAARNGSYTFIGLPPGDYYVAAIHEDTTPQWQDPKVLEALASSASQVRLGDGDARTQDVKTVKGGSQ